MITWKPIETAPDSTEIMVLDAYGVVVQAALRDGAWCATINGEAVTLDAPPAAWSHLPRVESDTWRAHMTALQRDFDEMRLCTARVLSWMTGKLKPGVRIPRRVREDLQDLLAGGR